MSFPALSPLTRKLFDLPDYAQREDNICSMVNFFPEARRLMDAIDVERIVEIGSEAGLNTAVLLDYVKSRKKKLVTVDPAAVPFPFSLSAEPAFSFYQETSAEFLRRNISAEVIFMDGDHNYETVLTDLKTIHETRRSSGIKLMFLHDVSWPWARQDIYYDPARIAHPHPFHAENRVSPYAEENAASLSPASYMTADRAGGAENGVLTAVEDFLNLHGDFWRFQRIPVLYGIGILIALDNITEEERRKLLPLVDELASHCELLSILELNRIENLCQYNALLQELKKAGDIWRNDQNYIRAAQAQLAENSSSIETLNGKLHESGALLNTANETWQKDQAYIQTLQAQLAEKCSYAETLDGKLRESGALLNTANETWQKDQVYIQTLQAQLAEKCSYAETLDGKLRESGALLNTANETWQKDQAYIQTLQAQLAEKCSYAETLDGKLREIRNQLKNAEETRQKDQDCIKTLHTVLWQKDQAFRRQKLLYTKEGRSMLHQGFPAVLLPYQFRNAGKIRRIRELLSGGTVKLLSLDIFDTLLFRELHSELNRFDDTAKILHARYPEISEKEFYHARALAHQMAYQTCSVTEGCREASAERIFSIMAKILGMQEHLFPELMNAEQEYETAHLHLNRSIWQLVLLAQEQNIPVAAVSDMYWGKQELQKFLDALLPVPKAVKKIYSSCDYGVSKLAGSLFDRVVREEGVDYPAILHIGDNRQSDFSVPFVRNGIQAFWLPRSKCYTGICRRLQKYRMTKLYKGNILHGVR